MTGDLSYPAEDLRQFDEELIEQYFSATSLSMSDRVDVNSAWQVTVPGISHTYPFLRHGLMSLAANHLQYECSPELQPLYSKLAILHQDKALEHFIPQLEAITKENCHALFASSILLLPLRYSFLVTSNEPSDAQAFLTEIIKNFDSLIGATVISGGTDEWIREGPLSPILTIRKLENIIPHLIEDPQNALTALIDDIPNFLTVNEDTAQQSSSHAENTTSISTYKHSIEVLSNAFPSTDSTRRYKDAMMGWSYFVGPDFIRLLKENDSLALVILGFYGVALHCFEPVWYLDGLGARLVEAVSQVISPVHMPLLQWPLAKTSSN